MQKTTTVIDSGWEVAERVRPGADLLLPEGGDRNWIPAQVPGHVHLDLIRAGVIGEPDFRMQEQGCQWVDQSDWTYQTTFTVAPDRSGGRHFLHFKGLDTIARVYLNATPVGAVENFFTPYRFDVTETLRAGENRLRVEFDSALRAGTERANAYLGDGDSERGKASYFNFAPRAFVRKAQYMFGWDWGPELVSCGIWQDVELVTVPRAEILDWRCDYEFTSETRVDMDIRLTIRKYDDAPLIVAASLFAAGDTTPMAILEGGPGDYGVTLPIRRFQTLRWSPNGSPGVQKRHLLNLKVTTVPETDFEEPDLLDFRGVSVGFRTVELIREPDADGRGESFKFRVNGVDTFAKGANWIPDGSFPAAITERRLRERLTQARDAGFNMLRVWGGGLYESDAFYSLCDELGLLVWQDFAFACSMYPDDLPAFCESVRGEAVANVRRLRHHPCLALWCGGNENLELAQDRWDGPSQATRFFGDRLIHDILPAVLAAEDSRTPYWPNSPYGGDKATSEDFGDGHYWNVWHAKTPESNGDWVHYAETRSRFLSEFGFAAPAGEAAWAIATLPADRTVDSAVSRWHDKTRKGYDNYLAYIGLHYPMPATWDDLLYYGQLNQADALRFGIEHCRRMMGRCYGTLFWQLNDCWPTHSWAVIDSAGVPKAAYFASKRFYAPLLLSLVAVEGGVAAHLVHDGLEPFPGRLSLRLLSFDGAEIAVAVREAVAPPTAASGALLTLAIPGDFDRWTGFVDAEFAPTDGSPVTRATHLLAEPRDLRLPDPAIEATVALAGPGRATVRLTCRAGAFAVRVSFAEVKISAEFSDNYVNLSPDRPTELSVAGLPAEWDADQIGSALRIRHLGERSITT
jgi:beta-mannosidase